MAKNPNFACANQENFELTILAIIRTKSMFLAALLLVQPTSFTDRQFIIEALRN